MVVEASDVKEMSGVLENAKVTLVIYRFLKLIKTRPEVYSSATVKLE